MGGKYAAGINNTSGIAAGVIDTGGKFVPVSLIQLVTLDMQISPRIVKKNFNDPNAIIRGLGEDD
jgi:hypothetical protein